MTFLRPSTPEEREMASAVRNQIVGPVQWKRQFEFGRAYVLIPPPEINKAIDCIQFSKDAHLAGCESCANLHYVRFLSIPIFNKDQTKALVSMTRSCGGLCGNGGVFVYHKTKDGWELEMNSFAECHWLS